MSLFSFFYLIEDAGLRCTSSHFTGVELRNSLDNRFEEIEGKLIYDLLLEELDPDLVKMQFQVAVIDKGFKAQDYFRKHPGRFISAHLADYSTELEKQVLVGQGIVDWKDLFEASKTGGVKNYFVEMDPDTFEGSAKYLMEV